MSSLLSQFESFEVSAGSLTFQGWAHGPEDGRLVVLLHGFPQSSAEWRSQLQALGDNGFRAVAFDQRGYSPGARPNVKDDGTIDDPEPYGIRHLMADVLAVMDDMGGHQFDVVGHDWGAGVAWQLAGTYPERVRTLTAVSVPHPRAFSDVMLKSDQAARSSYMLAFRNAPEITGKTLLAGDAKLLRAMYSGLDDAAVDHYVERMRDHGALQAGLAWYRAIGKDDVSGVGPVTTPTLFVWSDQDPAIGRAAAEACEKHVEGPFRFEVLEGVDHWVPEKAADRLNALLLDHLATA